MMLSDGVGEKAHRSISLSIFGEFFEVIAAEIDLKCNTYRIYQLLHHKFE